MRTCFVFAVAAMLTVPGMAQAAEVKLLASAALKAAYLELLPQFEAATGHKVTAAWSSSLVIQKRIASGEDADVVVMADILGKSLTDELIKQGKLVAGSPATFAKSGVGVAVRAGAPKPDISSAEALKKSIVAAKSIAYSAGASGTYLVSMLEKLGIYDQVKSKVATVKPSEPVGEVVARGDAEIGFHQVSELLPVNGIEFLGPLPADLQNITVYSGGVSYRDQGGRRCRGTREIPYRTDLCSDAQEARPGARLIASRSSSMRLHLSNLARRGQAGTSEALQIIAAITATQPR